MITRFTWLGAAAVVALASTPLPAAAQGAAPCGSAGYTYSLGLGGSLIGCFTGSLSQLGEDAGFISEQYYWAGNFGAVSGPTNAPTVAGTFMFDDNCGSVGSGTFSFCTGAFTKTPAMIVNPTGEMVLGLLVPDNSNGAGSNWVYSGSSVRNGMPVPIGFQSVLLQLTLGGVDVPGSFLFGWEDMNTGCVARAAVFNNRYRTEDLGDGVLLDSRLDDCTVINPGGNSDSDFNDSYMQFTIIGQGTPADVIPEPVTMSLMAIGLLGLGGASAAKRRKQK